MNSDEYAAKHGELLWRETVNAINEFAQDIIDEVRKDGPSVKPDLYAWSIVAAKTQAPTLVYTFEVNGREIEIEFGVHVIFKRLMSDAMKGAYQIRVALKKLEENRGT